MLLEGHARAIQDGAPAVWFPGYFMIILCLAFLSIVGMSLATIPGSFAKELGCNWAQDENILNFEKIIN